MEIKINVLGDFFLDAVNYEKNRNTISFENIIQVLNDSYLNIVNLEAPITSQRDKIKKNGPVLKNSKYALEIFEKLNIKLANLGNNHIKDYGPAGIKETLDLLDSKQIDYVGVCTAFDCSKNFYKLTVDNFTIGVYSLCEHEFSGFDNSEIGSNTYDEERCLKEIQKLKKESDYLIILFHGGKELYPYPTPNQQINCRNFVDSGANLVICQHSHCIGCEEEYRNALIVYGQGNFFFPSSKIDEYNSSLMISITIDTSKKIVSVNKFPLVLSGGKLKITDNKKVLDDFKTRSITLKNTGAESLYIDELLDNIDYLYQVLNKSKFYSRIDRYLLNRRLIKREIRKKESYLLFLYNVIMCETHREFFEKFIKANVLKK